MGRGWEAPSGPTKPHTRTRALDLRVTHEDADVSAESHPSPAGCREPSPPPWVQGKLGVGVLGDELDVPSLAVYRLRSRTEMKP